MSNYSTVGSNDMTRALPFYDSLLGSIGFTPVMDHPSGGRVYGGDGSMFAVLGPADGQRATVGNGTMAGFGMQTPRDVRQFYAKAIELGATCEGPPGPRGPADLKAYFAYVRDLDGNKLCGYVIGAPEQ